MKYKNLQLLVQNRVGLTAYHGNMPLYVSIFTGDSMIGHMKNAPYGVYEYFIGYQGQSPGRVDRFIINVEETI